MITVSMHFQQQKDGQILTSVIVTDDVHVTPAEEGVVNALLGLLIIHGFIAEQESTQH